LNARTPPITIRSEAILTEASTSFVEVSIFGGQFTAVVLIIPWIAFPGQELLGNSLNGFENGSMSGYCNTDVNCFSN
jgi:hypothetical protein